MQQLGFSWKDCGDVSYASNISKISLTPNPLNLPGNVTLGFSGELDMDLQAPVKVYCFVYLLLSFVIYCTKYYFWYILAIRF